MDKLVLHPTETSQWQALVYEAQAMTELYLNEHTESYLVFMLMRFSLGPQCVESVLALDFLELFHKPRRLQLELLQEVGDKSLLFCGLFPGLATRRRVSLDYYIDLGQSAYLTLSELHGNPSNDLYSQLHEKFIDLKTILQAMRGGFVKSDGELIL